MNYSEIYQQLMNRAVGRSRGERFYEKHHVVPRCMGGGDESTNLVFLTPEEHFVAHQLLTKIHPTNIKLRFSLQAMLMDTGNRKRKNKAYGWVRRLVSENMKANNPNQGGKARLAYIEKHGRPPIHSKYEFSKEGRERMVEGKTGINNPNHGCPPWLHPRRTDETIGIWKRADELHDWWLEHQGSYLRMSKAFGYTRHVGFMNVVKRFQQGWNPREDPQWLEFSPPE